MKNGTEEMRDITINRLPVRTWNWLQMNETSIPWSEHSLPCIVDMEEETPDQPQGSSKVVRMQIAAPGENTGDGNIHMEAAEHEHITVIQQIGGSGEDHTEKNGDLLFRTSFDLKPHSSVRLVQVLMPGAAQRLRSEVSCSCLAQASFSVVQVMVGEGDVYSSVHVDLTGDASSFEGTIGYLGVKQQVIDMDVVVNHLGRKTVSSVTAKGTLKENARKIFRGSIDLRKGCAGSKGSETEEVLLLGEGAVNRTIPLILCGEEDVEGNHGATIGELDEETLFYFASRGIGREVAENMMARAKLESVYRQIGDEQTETAVERKISEVMADEQA